MLMGGNNERLKEHWGEMTRTTSLAGFEMGLCSRSWPVWFSGDFSLKPWCLPYIFVLLVFLAGTQNQTGISVWLLRNKVETCCSGLAWLTWSCYTIEPIYRYSSPLQTFKTGAYRANKKKKKKNQVLQCGRPHEAEYKYELELISSALICMGLELSRETLSSTEGLCHFSFTRLQTQHIYRRL